MAQKVKFGVIGIGNMGSQHTVYIHQLETTELTAVCDVNPAAFERVDGDVRDSVAKFTDPEEFFAKADIDAVIVAVPHYFHPDLAIRAMENGKHVIVEKPIAVHKAEAERLLATAAKHPELVKAAMFNQRTLPAHIKIKNMIDSGELGKIQRLSWIITDWFRSQHYYDSGDWRASWRGEGGGVLLNQCPHQLDLMQWFFGLPCKVSASCKFGKFHDIEVEDEVNAYLEYPDGKTGNFIATTGEAPGTNRLEITGDNGKLVFEHGKIQFIRNKIPTSVFLRTTGTVFGTPETEVLDVPYDEPKDPQHRAIIRNVADAILTGAELIAPLEEGIRGLELGNAMLYSGWTGHPVDLPIDAADYAARLAKLAATSRYQKKSVTTSGASADDFAKSFGKR